MSYNVRSYKDLTGEERLRFFDFCKAESQETNQPAHANMWDIDWANKENTLIFILMYAGRFYRNNGEMFILYHNDSIIGCSGVCRSLFDTNIALAGVRTWIHKDYRNNSLLREYLLPVHKQWAIDRNYKQVILTFNEYNKNIINIFKRTRLAEKSGRVESRQPHHLFYSGLVEVDFPVTLYKNKQWVIYEALDPDWKFDWSAYEFIETNPQSP
jgi:hypothetical protein